MRWVQKRSERKLHSLSNRQQVCGDCNQASGHLSPSPRGCNSSSRCRQEVALKNEHFTLKQSRLHQTQDIKKEEKKKSSGRVHSVPLQGLHLHTNHFKSAKLNTGLHYPHTRYISQGHSINASIKAQLNLFVCFSPCSRESIFV